MQDYSEGALAGEAYLQTVRKIEDLARPFEGGVNGYRFSRHREMAGLQPGFRLVVDHYRPEYQDHMATKDPQDHPFITVSARRLRDEHKRIAGDGRAAALHIAECLDKAGGVAGQDVDLRIVGNYNPPGGNDANSAHADFAKWALLWPFNTVVRLVPEARIVGHRANNYYYMSGEAADLPAVGMGDAIVLAGTENEQGARPLVHIVEELPRVVPVPLRLVGVSTIF